MTIIFLLIAASGYILYGVNMNLGEKNKFTFWDFLAIVVVLVSISTLSAPRIAICLPSYKANQCQANIIYLNELIDNYKYDQGFWPGYMSELTEEGYLIEEITCPFHQEYIIGPDQHIIEHKH
jgi:hypothetical protein